MTKKAPATATSGLRLSSRIRGLLVVLAIVLLAANLRPALTSVAPLIGQIRTDTGISNGAAALLAGLPLLAFSVLSPTPPRLARRFDMERVLLASLLVLAVGILLRSAGVVAALFLGTAILGAAIAVGNVLLPSLVKREFPERTGLMTSTYTTALAVSAAIAAGASFPIAYQVDIGWRGSLALWALLALVAAVAWFPQIRSADPANASTGTSRGVTGLWSSVLAWQVTLFMGLQSLGYYVVLTWLPEILQEEVGVSAAQAGWILALSQVVVIPAMFLAPVLADRRPSQYSVVVVAVTLTGAGTLGLLVAASTATVLWIVLFGHGPVRRVLTSCGWAVSLRPAPRRNAFVDSPADAAGRGDSVPPDYGSRR